MYVCVSVLTYEHVSAGALGGQKRASGLMNLSCWWLGHTDAVLQTKLIASGGSRKYP